MTAVTLHDVAPADDAGPEALAPVAGLVVGEAGVAHEALREAGES